MSFVCSVRGTRFFVAETIRTGLRSVAKSSPSVALNRRAMDGAASRRLETVSACVEVQRLPPLASALGLFSSIPRCAQPCALHFYKTCRTGS